MVQQVFLDPPEISLFPLKDTEMLISLVRHHLTGKLAEEEFYLRVGLIFFFLEKNKATSTQGWPGIPWMLGKGRGRSCSVLPQLHSALSSFFHLTLFIAALPVPAEVSLKLTAPL